jgi:hypothetical protein
LTVGCQFHLAMKSRVSTLDLSLDLAVSSVLE